MGQRLAQDDSARRLEKADAFRVFLGDEGFEMGRAGRGHEPCRIDVVLHGNRNAVQRAAIDARLEILVRLLRCFLRPLLIDENESIQLAVQPVDRRESLADQPNRGERAVAETVS
jgi:hypothetical protein